MVTRRGGPLALLIALLLWLPAAAAAADDEGYASLCERAILEGARRGGVPAEVLHAIALTETGRSANGRLRPWPWAINREGRGHWFGSREEALAFARESIAAGRPSFDVGCVQINYRWHGHAFPSIEDMLDPQWTATYAAQFLRTLYEERKSWSAAAGAYHSLTPHYAAIYRERFDRILANIQPLDPVAVAALPEGRGSTRAGRREAERRARAAQVGGQRTGLLTAPPAPAAAPGAHGAGSLAGGLLAPAAGGLLAPAAGGLLGAAAGGLLGAATPLLSEASPLLAAPAAGLF